MLAKEGVANAAVVGFAYFKFICVFQEGAAVVFVACLHCYFCVPVIIDTGLGVFLRVVSLVRLLKLFLACYTVMVVAVLNEAFFFVVCRIGEFQFC